jgi:hypothetical protein
MRVADLLVVGTKINCSDIHKSSRSIGPFCSHSVKQCNPKETVIIIFSMQTDTKKEIDFVNYNYGRLIYCCNLI